MTEESLKTETVVEEKKSEKFHYTCSVTNSTITVEGKTYSYHFETSSGTTYVIFDSVFFGSSKWKVKD